MPSSLNGTGVTFNDGTQLNSRNEAGGNYILRTFNSPATWTKPTGLKAVKVTIASGGGGGGGVSPGTVQSGSPVIASAIGGFGGSGRGTSKYISAPSIPGPLTATVGTGGAGGPSGGGAGGAGGTSSFGSLLSATGGGGGAGRGPGVPPGTGATGAEGSAPNGDLSAQWNLGNAIYGTIGATGTANPSTGAGGFNGNPASGFMAGGGGARRNASRYVARPGATGGSGVGGFIIVEEFY